jgi:hypothetical protein
MRSLPKSSPVSRVAAALFLAALAGACSDEGGAGLATPEADVAEVAGPDAPSPDAAGPAEDAEGPVEADAEAPEPVRLALFSVDPGRGLAVGLEQVELSGEGLRDGLQVFFGESLAQDVFVLNANRLVLLTPPRPPGLVDVRVVDPETGEAAVLDDGFLYFSPVSVTEVEPDRGALLGGERVTVRGAGFRAGSVVLFGQRLGLAVEVIDDGTLLVTTPGARLAGPVDVHVTNDLGVGTREGAFRYVGAPTVSAVAPPFGPLAGGTVVELRGAGFEEPLAARLGEAPLTQVQVLSPTRLRGVTTAVSAAGVRDAVVTTAEGTGALSQAFAYLDPEAGSGSLTLVAVSPATGDPAGGEQVALIALGLGELQGTRVRFGDAEATVRALDPTAGLLTVTTPPGTGVVDVTLESDGRTASLAGAFRYVPGLRVDAVSPASGPVEGGTAVTVRGEGFRSGLELRIGALPAAEVRVVDATTITAVTPPGAPGLADVVVIQDGRLARRDDAFAYAGPYALLLVDPSRGAQAGGTEVVLVGSGFPADARVRFGGRYATHVEVLSSARIACRTPPGELGTVPVVVESAEAGARAMADAFTYYDPTTQFGGTWGGPIEGDVNVVVMDGEARAPIPDAFVMMWTDPRTPYQGFTDARGQITFSGPDLSGEQMVSASKEGYTRASVVEYDAKNVTVYLMPVTPPSPGPPPSPPPAALYRGRLTNLGKAVPVPLGRCTDYPAAAGTLCDACTDDAQCGAGGRCLELPNQFAGGASGRFCSRGCATSAQCGAGFNCLPHNGLLEMQCLPSAGVITAFCDVTNTAPAPLARDRLEDPGVQVNADMTFELNPPFGEFAVFCFAGVQNPFSGQFRPLALGVDRNRFAYPADELTGEVELRHPLNQTYRFALDDIPRGPDGPDIEAMWASLNLGPEGYIAFPPIIQAGLPAFTLENFLGTPTGDIAGSTFTFVAGSFSYFSNAQTITFHQGLPRLDNDLLFHGRPDGRWEARRSGITQNLNGLWHAGETTVGVGSEGLIVRSVGSSWARQPSGVSRSLRAVHGAGTGGAGALVAVGDGGVITRWDGLRWVPEAAGVTRSDLLAVWVAGPGEAVAVGNGVVLRQTAGAWAVDPRPGFRRFNGAWGFAADDVWIVGNGGNAQRWNGSTWTSVPTGTSLALRAIWGAHPNDVWIAGEGGVLLHWDGLGLTRVPLETTRTLGAVHGFAADDVWVVGSRGQAFHFDGATWERVDLGPAAADLDLLAVGGTSEARVISARNELVLGPFIPVPETLSPAEGGIMTNDYRLSWRSQPGTLPHFHYVEVAIPTMMGPVPEWTIVADFDVSQVLLPDFPSIEGTPGITAGQRIFSVIRAYKEGFDIDNHSNADMSVWGWRSWSSQSTNFSKL